MSERPVSFVSDDFLRDFVAAAEGRAAEPTLCIGKLDRRTFLRLTGMAGGGLMLGLTIARRADADATRTAEAAFVPNAWLKISANEIVIRAQNPEVGQGVKTSLPMVVAEELDAAWSDVRVEQSPIDEEAYGRQVAGGSRSIPSTWDALRRAGATARAMLVAAAAARWGVPPDECVTENSRVSHAKSGRSASYFELAAAAAELPVPDPEAVRVKERREYRLLGQRIGGVDNHAIVTGQPLFGSDQRLPGMRYAAYQKCPATGGRVRDANLDEVKRLPGVLDAFVLEGNGKANELMPGVAIVADSTWAALEAKRKLRVSWDESEAATDSWAAAVARAEALAGEPGERTVANRGDVESAFAAAAKTVESFYRYAFVSHAQLEPQTCTAWWRDGAIEIWAPTQTPHRALENAASVLGIPESKITLHQLRIGGGFGRRLVNDWLCETAAIARRVAAPVMLTWTREDDMEHDFFRAGGFHALKGAVDAKGRLAAWQDHFITFTHDGKGPVSGGYMSPQVFPGELIDNYRLSQTMLPWSTPCGAWRAPGSNVFGFVVQSFLHELAVAAGRDHLEFLLEVLGPPRWLEPGNAWSLHTGRAADVIRLAAEKAGWGARMPPGRGLGLAFYFSHAGHVAEVAEVSVEANRALRVHRVTVAADVGPIVNRSGAENQCEGAVIDGLSAMLAQQITHENGRVREINLDRYPLLRMPQAPRVEVHFIESDHPPTGLGEPALPPLAPAVCNAIFAATGQRVYELPLSKAGFTA